MFKPREIASHEILPLVDIKSGLPSTTAGDTDGGLRAIHTQAELGSVEAFYMLGLFYLYGWQPLEPDEETALIWFKKAAAEGHNDAQCAIGLLLYHGHGPIEADRVLAKSYFRLASNDDHSHGHWLLGRSLFQESSTSIPTQGIGGGNSIEAAYLLGLVADEIPQAAHQLAIMYEYGLVQDDSAGTTQHKSNLLKAAALYGTASRKGFVESMYHLALMYIYGRGVPQDYVLATELLQRAASNSQRMHAPSMQYLAVIYANGFSNPAGIADYDEALRWYELCVGAETEEFQ